MVVRRNGLLREIPLPSKDCNEFEETIYIVYITENAQKKIVQIDKIGK